MTSTLVSPSVVTVSTSSPDDIAHYECLCERNRALCGELLEDGPEAPDAPDEDMCVVCVELDRAYPNGECVCGGGS